MATRNDLPVLVTGGTGHYGRWITASLTRRGARVRVLARNAERARRSLGNAPEIVRGDATDAAARREALRGAGALVVAISAMSPELIRRTMEIEAGAVLALLTEAESLGVGRAIYLSVYEAREEVSAGLRLASGLAKVQVERALLDSRLDWTVLGCAPSMQLFFSMIRGSTMVVPGGGPPALPTVSAADVGEIAAEAALRADLGRRRFCVAGPEVLSFPEAARRISAVWGIPIGFRAVPLALPALARAVTWPLARASDRLSYANQMLGFIGLLNRFPPEVAAGAPAAHALLRETFDYVPTTLEKEALLRMPGQGPESPAP